MRFKIPKKQPSSFRTSARYLAGLSHGKSPDRVDWMFCQNLETENPDAGAAIMSATATQSKRCKQPVYHFILTFDPKDAGAGKISHDKMKEIAVQTIELMGLKDYQAMIYAHKDTDHPHIHFLVNRIHPEYGKAYDRHRDGTRLRDITRDLAEEHGLNVLKSKNKDRDLVDDMAGNLTEGQYRQAEKDGDLNAKPFTKEKLKALRGQLRDQFHQAESWKDLEQRLSGHGYYLSRKGQGLVVTDGERFAKLSDMGKGVRLKELEGRFEQSFTQFRDNEIQKEADKKKDYTAKTDKERAQERLDQDNAPQSHNAIRRLDAADQDYLHWSSIEQEYKSRQWRITHAEKKQASVEKNRDRQFEWNKRHGNEFLARLDALYGDGGKVKKKWAALEKQHGITTAEEMIKADPSLLGPMKHHKLFEDPKAKQKEMKREFRKLITVKRKYRDAKNRLDDAQHEVQMQKRALDKARYEYEVLINSMGTLEQVRTIVRQKVKSRAYALSRVSAKMLREANLADERRQQLHKAWRKHNERKREREKRHSRIPKV